MTTRRSERSHNDAAPATRRRQARGAARAALLLDAAEEIFAEVGYERATTNAIAARAGCSPGTLYQFFSNKSAFAEGLAQRYLAVIQKELDGVARPGPAGASDLDSIVERLVSFLVTFTVTRPAFPVVFGGSGSTSSLQEPAAALYAHVLDRVEDVVAREAPGIPAARRRRSALVALHMIKGLLPVVEAADPAERAAVIAELRAALVAYLRTLPDRLGE